MIADGQADLADVCPYIPFIPSALKCFLTVLSINIELAVEPLRGGGRVHPRTDVFPGAASSPAK